MALLADTRGAKLTKMLSEANQQNWFLKRQVSTHTHIVYIVFVPNYRWIIGKKMYGMSIIHGMYLVNSI